MNHKVEILDIMRYGLHRKKFQAEDPELFLEVQKFFQNEDNKHKFLESEQDRNWEELLDLQEIQNKIENQTKKKSFIYYLLPLAAILLFGLDIFLIIGRILFNKESSYLSFTETNQQLGILYSDGFILLFLLLAFAMSISFFYLKKIDSKSEG